MIWVWCRRMACLALLAWAWASGTSAPLMVILCFGFLRHELGAHLHTQHVTDQKALVSVVQMYVSQHAMDMAKLENRLMRSVLVNDPIPTSPTKH